MIHISSSDNSRNIKYSVNAMGAITIYSLDPKVVSSKEKLREGGNLSQSIIVTTIQAKLYQNVLASLLIESDKPKNAININYVSFPKIVQKPNKFEVESQRLLNFND